jgi:hypothetical protein
MKTPSLDTKTLPEGVTKSGLWQRIGDHQDYVHQIQEIRNLAGVMAQKISVTMRPYTDHSIAHMDALWSVTDKVFTETEISLICPGEAFLLAASFYLHDLGMASTATEEGKLRVRATENYKAAFAMYSRTSSLDPSEADARALQDATREVHASEAAGLATKEIPGLGRFLIEDSEFRRTWAHTIGQIAASHHWSMTELERSLGVRGAVPGPGGGTLDLAFVACALRIVDFAHISRGRAPHIERLLRGALTPSSAVHWDAQANIIGPGRESDFLVYASAEPIKSTDAWWLFFDMCTQLNIEIKAVYDYLRGRTISSKRFSLKGVKSIERPEAFNELVQLDHNLLPLDIRIQPRSMERVVELLGGKQVYGMDELAPIRELIQNARDAIKLRQAMEAASGRLISPGLITVGISKEGEGLVLRVTDNGVGMTRGIVLRHLVAVGSNFWNSPEFFSNYQLASEKGFRPIGKFGIGFLSVFMLGDVVEVNTEASGSNRIKLTLNGLGKRGQMGEGTPTGNSGTQVSIVLKHTPELLVENLKSVVQSRAPMIDIQIIVEVEVGDIKTRQEICPGWWRDCSEESIVEFVLNWPAMAWGAKKLSLDDRSPSRSLDYLNHLRGMAHRFGGKWSVAGWPASKPGYVDDSQRLLNLGGESGSAILVCSQGIAVGLSRFPDVAGVMDIGPAELTVSRESFTALADRRKGTSDPQEELVHTRILQYLRPVVISKLDRLGEHGMIPGRMEFIRGLAEIFGREVLTSTTLKWIPVTVPPGNLEHQSVQELGPFAENRDRVLLAAGVSGSGIYSAAAPHVSGQDLGAIPIIAISKEELEVSYPRRDAMDRAHRDGLIKAPLKELLSIAGASDKELIVTKFLIGEISKAWRVGPEKLLDQTWVLNYKDSILIADLRRP